MGNSDLKFITCEKCGKKLIERKKNGIFHFMFGKPGKGVTTAPVEMFIQGNIRIKCLRRNCNHWQVLSYLPNIFQSEDDSETDCETKTETIKKL